jgi:hypothetical protein
LFFKIDEADWVVKQEHLRHSPRNQVACPLERRYVLSLFQVPLLHIPLFKEILIYVVELLMLCSDDETKTILRWLSPVNYWLKQEDVTKQREVGTGQWLLEDPDFLEWENGNTEMLWCCGSRELHSPVVTFIETKQAVSWCW